MITASVRARCPGGFDDRFVAGTAAQVSGKSVVNAFSRGMVVVFVESEEGHDESRRAVSALTPIRLDHRLLNRVVRAGGIAEIFHGDHLFAVHHGEKDEA